MNIKCQWLIKLFRKWSKRFFSEERFVQVRPFLDGLISVILQVLLILLLMQIIGIRLTLFAAVIASFGVAAGLPLSGTLQNFASGVLILLLRPYKIGDNIVKAVVDVIRSSKELLTDPAHRLGISKLEGDGYIF